jgi:hypothetical protein
MSLAILYNETISVPGWDNGTTDSKEIQVFKEFGSEAELLAWVETNDRSPYSKKFFRVLQFQDLIIERKLSLKTVSPKAKAG